MTFPQPPVESPDFDQPFCPECGYNRDPDCDGCRNWDDDGYPKSRKELEEEGWFHKEDGEC